MPLEFLSNNRILVAGLAALLLLPVVVLVFGKKKQAPVLSKNVAAAIPIIKKELVCGPNSSCEAYLFRFGLPTPESTLGLPLGHHVSLSATIGGEVVSRSYTPTSAIGQTGHFDLVVKVYPTGKLTPFLASLEVGDTVDVKGPKGRFSLPTGVTAFNMVAAGSGITPVFQVALQLLQEGVTTPMRLIYANVKEGDILIKTMLDDLAATHSNFSVQYILSKPDGEWSGANGRVSQNMMEETFTNDGSAPLNLLCGPLPFNKAMKASFKEMGYEKSQIFTF